MSLYMYGSVKEKCIDEKLLEKTMIEFFSSKNTITKQVNERCVTYEGITENNKVIISFLCEEIAPGNVWDSNIIGGEFEFTQSLIFDIDKEYASVDTYKTIIEFCKHLKTKIESDILITSDMHNDMCLLKGQEIIWADSISWKYTETIISH